MRPHLRMGFGGLRGRLLLSLVATSAITLAVAAVITLGPLQSRLRDESVTALVATKASSSRPRSPRSARRIMSLGSGSPGPAR